MPSKQKASDPVTHLIGGAVSGLCACVFVQPLDLIKTRLQQQQQAHLAFIKQGGQAGLTIAPLESTIWKTVFGIIKEGSVLSLWRGTAPTIVRNVPGAAMYFTVLNEARTLLARRKVTNGAEQSDTNNASGSALPKLSNTENLVAGGASRAAIGFVMMPATVIKVRYESNLYNYKSMSGAFTSIFRTEGIRGLWAGFGATAMRDAPLAGLYVLFYEQAKTYLGNLRATSSYFDVSTPTIHMVAGVTAGFFSTTLTHPFDMLKTRMQLKPAEYKNVLQAARKVLMEEGAIGFLDGILVRTVRKSIHSAISWTVYEEVVRWHVSRKADHLV
ncbi:MAG: mitochondrial carrier domain-containing protein [Linnemannia elongata]|nr:MAG: mitochondrial carrier domain-containing protein [Linnemannia elongata]